MEKEIIRVRGIILMSNFKVGDKVKCIQSPINSNEHIGKVVTVSKITENGSIEKIQEWEASHWLYVNNWFEKIECPELKFKVGDMVNILSKKAGWTSYSNWENETKNQRIDRIDIDKGNTVYVIGGDFFLESDLEFAKEKIDNIATTLTYSGLTGGMFNCLHDVQSMCFSNPICINGGEIIISKKTLKQKMKTISIKLRAALGETKANQIVAELRHEDLSLTSSGKDVVLNAIADGENPVDALVAEATRIIEESKKEKN